MNEPRALIVEWVNSLYGTAHVSTQFDPAHGLPQLVVTLANVGWPTLGDNRADPALRTVDVAVTAFGAGGDRPDFAGAYAALQLVLTAAADLWAVRFETADGTLLVNGNDIVVTRAVDPDTNAATVTATFTLTAIAPPPAGS
jgi:hypothetical protein